VRNITGDSNLQRMSSKTSVFSEYRRGLESSANIPEDLNLRRKKVTLNLFHTNSFSSGKGKGKKGKEIPLQTWTGPESSRSLRLPYLKIIGI